MLVLTSVICSLHKQREMKLQPMESQEVGLVQFASVCAKPYIWTSPMMPLSMESCTDGLVWWPFSADHTQSSMDMSRGLTYSKPSNSDWSMSAIVFLKK